MTDMSDRHLSETDERAEEPPPPPLPYVSDLLGDDANETSHDDDMTEAHKNEDAKLEIHHMMKPANSNAAINQQQNGEYEVKTSSFQNTLTTVPEEFIVTGALIETGAAEVKERVMSVGVSGEEERENGMREIVLEYDSGEDMIELDLDKFETHASHCPNCSHRITTIILRRKNIPVPVIKEDKHIPPANGSPIFLQEETNKGKEGRHDGEDRSSVITTTKPNESVLESGNNEIKVQQSISTGHVPLPEILKCIVYGGLMESITSLSIVAAAAATDATTLNVLSIGSALLFSGLVALGLNLVDLKNDANTNQYEELLGSKNNFVLHATLVVLSYLVCGLIPPTAFAFAFLESNDKDYKIIAMAAAAFACIFILAIAKAYVSKEEDKFSSYVVSIRHHLLLALFISGVVYALGCTIEMYALEFGWFTSVQRVTCYTPKMVSTDI